jgi:membrane protease YdiL (CAAX protease family)
VVVEDPGQRVGTRGVAWGRVALFYAIAFGGVCLLGVAFAVSGADMRSGPPAIVFQLTVAFLYMPIPLVAGLVVERVAGRGALITRTWSQLKAGWLRVVGVSVLAAVAIYAANMGLTLLLGNAMGIEGVGRLVSTQAGLLDAIAAAVPQARASMAQSTGMPPVGLLYPLGIVSGIVAGFTINGLFAFGEEYGWRGVLMDELAPLGAFRANLLTGVMWGLWHAPIIMLGFNYGEQWALGAVMMCVWVTPFSFLLWRSREYSGSVLAPAVIHGAFNGSAGFFLLLVASRAPLLSAPVGIVGALSATMAATAVWWVTASGIRSTQGTVA